MTETMRSPEVEIRQETELAPNQPIMHVADLRVEFKLKDGGVLTAVDGVDLDINQREIVGLVGESGCGKTVLSLSLLRLIESPGRIKTGEILWQGRDLLQYSDSEIRSVRGREIAMIFQNPQSCLNPVYPVGEQLTAVIRLHRKLASGEAKKEALQLLKLVEIADADWSCPHF